VGVRVACMCLCLHDECERQKESYRRDVEEEACVIS